MPGAATVGQLFTSEGALTTAVMLGVNRPNYVRLALWRALGTNADPKAETGRLLQAVIRACTAAKQTPRPGQPFTDVHVNAAGAIAQAAYQALQSFLVPAPALPTGGEAALRAAFESKAMLLYKPRDARHFRREGRFATVRVQFP